MSVSVCVCVFRGSSSVFESVCVCVGGGVGQVLVPQSWLS